MDGQGAPSYFKGALPLIPCLRCQGRLFYSRSLFRYHGVRV